MPVLHVTFQTEAQCVDRARNDQRPRHARGDPCLSVPPAPCDSRPERARSICWLASCRAVTRTRQRSPPDLSSGSGSNRKPGHDPCDEIADGFRSSVRCSPCWLRTVLHHRDVQRAYRSLLPTFSVSAKTWTCSSIDSILCVSPTAATLNVGGHTEVVEELNPAVLHQKQ